MGDAARDGRRLKSTRRRDKYAKESSQASAALVQVEMTCINIRIRTAASSPHRRARGQTRQQKVGVWTAFSASRTGGLQDGSRATLPAEAVPNRRMS